MTEPAASPRVSLESPWVLPVILAILVYLVYAGTLAFGFVYDDVFEIVDNPWLTVSHIPQYFTRHVWAFSRAYGVYWRPLFLLWLLLNKALIGLHAAGWHASTVLMHAVATALVYRLGVRLTRDRATAAMAALIFGVHPALIESVAWISGVSD